MSDYIRLYLLKISILLVSTKIYYYSVNIPLSIFAAAIECKNADSSFEQFDMHIMLRVYLYVDAQYLKR